MKLFKSSGTLKQIPRGIWVLGFVSMFMDISSEIVHSLLPVYLVSTLGVSNFIVGIIEGVAEATALIVKIFSGILSDYIGKRKGLALAGYGMAALTKPLFPLASSAGVVFCARFLDRIGKGIRGAPRDALVADLAPENIRGACFGLRQSLDTVGAFTGPFIAVAVLLITQNHFQTAFWVAVVPAFLAVLLLAVGVDDAPEKKHEHRKNPITMENLRALKRPFWNIMVVGSVFTLARFSEAFLILKGREAAIPVAYLPLVLVVMNMVYCVVAYPFGKLADKMDHSLLLAWGLLVLVIADVVLGMFSNWSMVIFGVALWGIHMGMSQGLFSTMIAHTAPGNLRGTAFGIYNLITGITMLIASSMAGFLWDKQGSAMTFYAGALFSAAAFFGLLYLRKRQET